MICCGWTAFPSQLHCRRVGAVAVHVAVGPHFLVSYTHMHTLYSTASVAVGPHFLVSYTRTRDKRLKNSVYPGFSTAPKRA